MRQQSERFETMLKLGEKLSRDLIDGWNQDTLTIHDTMLVTGQLMVLCREDGPLSPLLKLAGEHARYQAGYKLLGGDGVVIPQTKEYREAEARLATTYLTQEGIIPEMAAACIALTEKPPAKGARSKTR